MPSTNEEIAGYIKQHIREIVPFLRKKSEEKDFTNEELMRIADISKSTFYRIWKIGSPAEEVDPLTKKPYMPDPDTICRLCLAIGVSLKEHDQSNSGLAPVSLPGLKEKSHEMIMDNLWGEISTLRAELADLAEERSRLMEDNKKLIDAVFSRDDDIRVLIAQNTKLTDALLSAKAQ